MKKLTQNEIGRTAFPKFEASSFQSQFGNAERFDKNKMCVYCKNEHTEVVRDPTYLKDFDEFYKDKVKTFTVVNCPACEAVFSFYEPLEKNN